MPLNEQQTQELIALLEAGKSLPEEWRQRLFPYAGRHAEVGKEYRLVYDGKLTREEVLAQTPAAPWQLEREFCTERPQDDGWRNLLVWGDNLLALRELLADQKGANRLGTRGRIKLIYIDPPFATRQDFMKDKEKAYRDKVLGAQFIEFLRRRLILLHEVLADDGFICVHLDSKKIHYVKAVMDEVFDETNFRNEVILPRPFTKNLQQQFKTVNSLNVRHDTLLCYSKNVETRFRPIWVAKSKVVHPEGHWHHAWSTADRPTMRYPLFGITPKTGQWVWGKSRAEQAIENYGRYLAEGAPRGLSLAEYWEETGKTLRFIRKDEEGKPQYWRAPADQVLADTLWLNVLTYENEKVYATQKHEDLLARIVGGYSSEGDIVLDCFAGSGTTAAVAEKLGRRWIAMDCGKLAIYTTQKRLFSLTTNIGATKKDDRAEPERVEDWAAHLKGSPGVLLITEKARNGEAEVTLDLLHDLAALAVKHGLAKKGVPLSLVCPEDKLRISEEHLEEPEDGLGAKRIAIDLKEGKTVTTTVEFRISLISPKNKPEKERPLPAKAFALYRAGVYDMAAIKALPWADYRPFVLKLFGVREHPHARYGLGLDGYIGTHSVLLWDYPDHPALTLDYGYVDDLHRTLRGKRGERFYVIAPVVAMAFAEDEVSRDETTYVFLKVPLSVLLRLIEAGVPAALKQPAKEDDVNEVIDAVGFDFISQPQVAYKVKKVSRQEGLFTETDYVLEISEFRARTLATDPEDFQNFETFSIAMVDTDYDGDVFRLARVFWGENLVTAAGGLEKAERLELRLPEADFTGNQMMVILCDRYGNEKKLTIAKMDFEGGQRQISKTPAKQGARESTKRKAK